MILVFLVVFVSGCASLNRKEAQTGYVKVFTKEPIRPCKVAILPFKNEIENDENAGEKVATILYSGFVSTGVDVVLPGEVRKLMIGRHFFTYQNIPDTLLLFLRNNMSVGLVVTGRVIEYKPYGGGSRYPEIRVWIEGISTKTGRRVFTAYITRRGDDYRKILEFGVVKSIAELTFRGTDELIKKLQEAGIKCIKE
ncbi:hypothetical protein SAMN06265340_103141 [Desulfurobacterium atlanticum]|uniref:Lipoprotein n=1 Tax=Desulfurobacterium atlanticum TaxID=240169 RepID=A0A238YHB7_9BACT|nr:hypothetical protein SAMN06265340_103141 [Desulfurobacterium atlanticum]